MEGIGEGEAGGGGVAADAGETAGGCGGDGVVELIGARVVGATRSG